MAKTFVPQDTSSGLRRKKPAPGSAGNLPVWERIAALASALIFLGALLWVALRVPNPQPFQVFIFRSVLALAAGAFTAFISGFMHVEGKWARFSIRAGGGLAVFLLVYSSNPPHLLGTATEAICGSTSNVVIPPAPIAPPILDIDGKVLVRLAADGALPNGVGFHEIVDFQDSLGQTIAEVKQPTLTVPGLTAIDAVYGKQKNVIETSHAAAPSRGEVPSSLEYVYEVPVTKRFVIDGTSDEIWAVISRLRYIHVEIKVSANQGRDLRDPIHPFPKIFSLDLELGGDLRVNSMDANRAVQTVAQSHDGETAWELLPLPPGSVRVASTTLEVRSRDLDSFEVWRLFAPHD
jgi:hypothetical protein